MHKTKAPCIIIQHIVCVRAIISQQNKIAKIIRQEIQITCWAGEIGNLSVDEINFIMSRKDSQIYTLIDNKIIRS